MPSVPSILTYRNPLARTIAPAWVGLLVVACICVSLYPVTASASTLPDDIVGDVTVSQLGAGQAPDLSMWAGALVTPDGRMIWARDPDTRHAMASTTKIMTAVVVLENAELDDVVTISARATSIGESEAGLRAGETYTVRELLEALIVHSGNDAAEALAEHVGGSEAAFVEMMNEKAQALGLSNTHFANAHGLDAQDHYTSARDLATLSLYAMRDSYFRRIAGLKSTTIDGGNGPRTVENRNTLLGSMIGANGIKTGWTSDAGFCLAASAMRSHLELIAIVLGAPTEKARFTEAEELLEWGFEHYGPVKLTSADETLTVLPVADYLDREVGVVATATVQAPVFDLDGEVTSTLSVPYSVEAPLARGDRVGTLTFTQGERLIAQVPVVVNEDVPEPGVLEKAWIWTVRAWRGLFGEG